MVHPNLPKFSNWHSNGKVILDQYDAEICVRLKKKSWYDNSNVATIA